jgi:fluoride exporter
MGQKLFLLCAAGTLGTLARYGMSGVVQRLCGEAFPWGTLAVNALGSFLFGVVWSLADERSVISGETRFIVLTGFMGAFTTFSTFAFETSQQLRDSEWLLACGNITVQLVLGLVLMVAGIALGRWI